MQAIAQLETSSPAETLKSVFGFDTFRPGQERVIEALLAGRSAVAIFPTGGGKSLCYQLPALLFDGITLVVSPLIALMKDQIDFLTARGVAAARLDSTVESDDARQIYRDMHNGRLKLLYIAPERLGSERFLQTLSKLKLSMMAVDEAHCISEWGHNFRPDYLKLSSLAKELRVPRVLSLTATATPSVARDIAGAFDVADSDVVKTGFYRSNLELRITPCTADQKDSLLLERLRTRPRGPTIIYVTLQKTAEAVAAMLAENGFPGAEVYHAGIGNDKRHEVQDRFMAGSDSIVVATIAFGMGIDKADIRYVYHYNLPKGPENYMQEIGRAGRDGKPSVCELFAAAGDVIALENFSYGDTPAPEAIESLLADVLNRGEVFDLSMYDLCGDHDIRPLVVETLLTYLELDGIIESTGPFYTEYKVQMLSPMASVMAKFDARRQQFLKALFASGRMGKTWLTIEIGEAVAATGGSPRERIVAALNYLEEQGDLTLQVAGVRQGYRRAKPSIDSEALLAEMVKRFAERERRDVSRIGQMLSYATHPGCRWQYLLDYFGDSRPAGCGHCDRCLGEPAGEIPPAKTRTLGPVAARSLQEIQSEGNKALESPRQMARFLCGLGSPALTKAKLMRHAKFGALANVPFQEVLKLVESAT
jgi:ATP-dependent DNA helicase RecQ